MYCLISYTTLPNIGLFTLMSDQKILVYYINGLIFFLLSLAGKK